MFAKGTLCDKNFLHWIKRHCRLNTWKLSCLFHCYVTSWDYKQHFLAKCLITYFEVSNQWWYQPIVFAFFYAIRRMKCTSFFSWVFRSKHLLEFLHNGILHVVLNFRQGLCEKFVTEVKKFCLSIITIKYVMLLVTRANKKCNQSIWSQSPNPNRVIHVHSMKCACELNHNIPNRSLISYAKICSTIVSHKVLNIHSKLCPQNDYNQSATNASGQRISFG